MKIRLTSQKLSGLTAILFATISNATPLTYINSGHTGPNLETYTFTATGSGQITAYFAGQAAEFGSVIGISVNGTSAPAFGLQNHASAYAAPFVLGSVIAGDVVTFVLLVSQNPAGPPATDFNWYSNSGLNADGLNHIFSASYPGDAEGILPGGTYVAFEDSSGLGDADYDDYQFVFTGPLRTSASSVPEHNSTFALLGLCCVAMITCVPRQRSFSH